MKGLSIDFKGTSGITLAVTEFVTDFRATTQDGMLNIACTKGSDIIYPDRGTNLYKDALAGKVPTLTDAYHVSNFAALDTKFFLNSVIVDGGERVDKIVLEPFSYENNRLKINATFTGDAGTTVGINVTI